MAIVDDLLCTRTLNTHPTYGVLMLFTLYQATTSTITATPSVILEHSVIKIRPAEQYVPSTPFAGVTAAKNEYESFQVIINSVQGSSASTISSIEIKDLDFPAMIHRQRYINITTVSDCDGALGLWPDALVPTVDPYFNETRNALPVTLPPYPGNQAFWIDLFIPKTAAAGRVSGNVVVTLSDGTESTAELEVEIWDFTLPSTSTQYVTTYNCKLNSILDGKYPTHKPSNISNDELYQLQRMYAELGLMHRITFSDFLQSESAALEQTPPDWKAVEDHWRDLLNGAALPFGLDDAKFTTVQLPNPHYPPPRVENNTLIDEMWKGTGCTNPTPEWGYAYWSSSYDYGASDMMSYCDHSLAHEHDPWSKCCGNVTSCTLQHPVLPPYSGNDSAAVGFWSSAVAHAKSANWADRIFDYTCDEPNADASRYAACKARGTMLHKVPGMKSLITTEKPSSDAVNMTKSIDIFVPIINFMDNNVSLCSHYPSWANGSTRAMYDSLEAEGKSLWWYQSCMSEGCASAPPVPGGGCNKADTCTKSTWPSYMIDTGAVFNRVMSWASYLYRIQGELYWGTNAADETHIGQSWDKQYIAGGNGDGSLTYPGRPEEIGGKTFIPISSIRLKLIRDGLEDLEYAYMLEKLKGRDVALAKITSVIHTAYDFEKDPSKLINARNQMGKLLSSTVKASTK